MNLDAGNRRWYMRDGGWKNQESDSHPPVLRVLGFDPGKVNFGWSVTDHVVTLRGGMASRVVASGMVPELPGDLSGDVADGIRPFSDFATRLRSRFVPDAMSVERFMASGLRVGTTMEIANLLAGVLAHFCRLSETAMYMVPAVTWKTAFNRAMGGKDALKDVYAACAATPHQIDASLVGCWAASEMCLCAPFESLAGDRLVPFLETLETTSTGRLRNVRV